MVRSLFVTASAGSGKTFRLTQEVRRHIGQEGELIVAATFTRAAAAEMEKRILDAIENGPEERADKLRLIMRASKVRFSTIDALFHRFLSTETYVPQVAMSGRLSPRAPTRAFSRMRASWPTSRRS